VNSSSGSLRVRGEADITGNQPPLDRQDLPKCNDAYPENKTHCLKEKISEKATKVVVSRPLNGNQLLY